MKHREVELKAHSEGAGRILVAGVAIQVAIVVLAQFLQGYYMKRYFQRKKIL